MFLAHTKLGCDKGGSMEERDWSFLYGSLFRTGFKEIFHIQLNPTELLIVLMKPHTSILVTVVRQSVGRNLTYRNPEIWGMSAGHTTDLSMLRERYGINVLVDMANPGEKSFAFYGYFNSVGKVGLFVQTHQPTEWLPWPQALRELLKAKFGGWNVRVDWSTLPPWVSEYISDPFAAAQPPLPIAVSNEEAKLYGCPYCGSFKGFHEITTQGASLWLCANKGCESRSVFLDAGMTESPMRFKGVAPQLQPHPRRQASE